MPASYLDDTDQPENASRIAELCAYPPRRLDQGLPVFPALLATPGEERNPLAVITNTGHIGSLHNREATEHQRLVEYILDHGYYCVIEVAVEHTTEQYIVRTIENVRVE